MPRPALIPTHTLDLLAQDQVAASEVFFLDQRIEHLEGIF